MDKAALVTKDLEVEGLLIAALRHAQIPVTAVDWNWVPQLGEWQLIVVTPLYDTKGPREAYARINKALSLAPVYQSIPVPIRRLFVKSPEDPFAQELIRQLKLTTEGTIHILKHSSKNGRVQYSPVFAPYLGKGGPIPSATFEGEAELRSFLEKRVGILPYAVDQAVSHLQQRGRASIFNVQLNLRQARKLKLAA